MTKRLQDGPALGFRGIRDRCAREGFCETVRDLVHRPGMEVPLCCGDSGVTHCGLDGRKVQSAGDEKRSVAVSKVMETEGTQLGVIASPHEAPPERRSIEPPTVTGTEHIARATRELVSHRIGRSLPPIKCLDRLS